jgi:hypothetical protein
MVETRLARLPLQARRVLRSASVFGEVCWESGVATLLGGAVGTTMVGEWLGRLVEQEVLVARPDSRFPGERELAFRHALLREGAYATLTADDERLAHRLAGEWLERRGETDPMVLASHFQRGGDGARAAQLYFRATEQAGYVLDNEAAMSRATLGLSCDPPPELRIALLGARCQAAQFLRKTSLADAEELLRTAPQGSIPWAQGMLAYYVDMMMAGRIEEAMASLARLPEVTPTPEGAGWMSFLYAIAVFNLDALGLVRQGTALEEPFFALVRTWGDQVSNVPLGWNLSVGLRASYAHDDPWNGFVHSEAFQPLHELVGGDIIYLEWQLLRGMNQWYLGALAPAIAVLEAIPAADTMLSQATSYRRWTLSWLHADRGALDQARAVAIELTEACQARHDRVGEGRGRWALAEALRRSGDLGAAEREIQTALAMVMPIDQPGALATLSALRLAQGRAADALAVAEDALARCQTMGGCGMFRGAFVRLVAAEALHATGAHDAARHAIADARVRLHAMADKIADPAYRASFLAEVPENARTLALATAWLGDRPPDPLVTS